jgi:hypothetical protein
LVRDDSRPGRLFAQARPASGILAAMRGANVVLAIALSAGVGVAACGGTSLKAAGEECVAASECGAGLQCDFGSTPPVCSEESTLPDPADADPNAPDAGPPPPDAPPGTPDAPPLPPDARVDAEPPPPDAELAVDAEPV